MKEVSKEELAIILDKHAKYLNGGDGGERADLSDADLSDADLRSADLRSATGQYFITQRADGYQFFLVLDEDGRWYIRAGCQYMSIEDYRKHTESYGEKSKKAETNLILDFAEAKLRSIKDVQPNKDLDHVNS